MRVSREGEIDVVRFSIHPLQRLRRGSIDAVAPLRGHRWVRSSNGQRSLRPTIVTTLHWGEHQWPIELTLTNRDEMGFRMLLGRQALRNRVVIDPGRSFLAGRPAINNGDSAPVQPEPNGGAALDAATAPDAAPEER